MPAFTSSGIAAQIKGLAGYLSGLRKMEDGQDRVYQSGKSLGSGFDSIGKSVLGFGGAAAKVATVGIATLGTAVAGLGVVSVNTATSYESAFAGVVKTTDGLTSAVGVLNKEGQALRQEFVNLSREVPIAFEELAAIGELGGQLGIGKSQLIEFTDTVAALGVATNLAQEEAASGLAQVANIFSVSADDMGENITRMGSSIVALGNNFATTEKDILSFGQRIAGAGSIAGLTQADIFGIGAAMSSVGVEAEAGGTAVQKVLLSINNAVTGSATGFADYSKAIEANTGKMQKLNAESARLEATMPGIQQELLGQYDAFIAAGGSAEDFGRQLGDKMRQKAFQTALSLRELQQETDLLKQQHGQPVEPALLNKFAQVAGISANDFKAAWEQDAAGAFQMFVEGLGAAGDDAIGILDELGLTDQRLIRSFLSLSGAGDLLGRTLDTANTAFEENSALADEAAQRYATTESKIAIFKNTLRSVADAVGQRLLPIFNKVLDYGTKFVTDFSEPILKGIDKVLGEFDKFGIKGAAVSLLGLLGFDPSQISEITAIADSVMAVVGQITTAFQTFGARGAAVSILGLLGLDPSQIGMVMGMVDTVIQAITGNFDALKGALVGIGAALAGGVIVTALLAIGGAIAALATPVTAIIGIAALLGAAWAGNWGNIQAIALTALEVLNAVWAGIMAGLQPAIASFQQIGMQLSALGINWSTVWQAILTATQIVGAALGAIFLALTSVLVGLVSGISAALATVIPMFQQIVEAGATFVAGVMQLFEGNLHQGLLLIFQGLSAGIAALYGGMIETVLALSQGFVDGVIKFWEGLYQSLIGGSIVPDLVNGIIDAFTMMGTDVGQAVTNMVNRALGLFRGFINKAKELFSIEKFIKMGSDVIKGLVKGIKENANKVVAALGDVVKKAIAAVLDRLGIKSPSKVFSDIGNQLVDGLILGIKKKSGQLDEDIETVAKGAIQAFNDTMKKIDLGKGSKEGLDRFRDKLRDHVKTSIQSALSTGSTLGAADLAHNIRQTMLQNFDGATVGHDMVGALSEAMAEAVNRDLIPVLKKIGQQIAGNLAQAASQFATLGITAAKRLLQPVEDNISRLEDRLQEVGDTEMFESETESVVTLKQMADELTKLEKKHAFLNSVGQELSSDQLDRLLNLRKLVSKDHEYFKLQKQISAEKKKQTELAKKQAEIEKQQADLQFLQQQLGLLSTIRELGLNPADILKGIKLGLDADLDDLVGAMGAVVQRIINQVDNTLQIASPSKVMMDRGQQVVAGLKKGIARASNNLSGTIQPMLQSNVLAPTLPSPMAVSGPNNTIQFGDIIMRDEGMSPAQVQQLILTTVSRAVR